MGKLPSPEPGTPDGGGGSWSPDRGAAAYRHALKQGKPSPPAAEAGGLLKTGPSGPELPPETSGEDGKYRRAARFLILIGGDQAARIISQLDPGQVERISREIASIRGITAEEAEAVLGEFRSLLAGSRAYSGSSSGGVEAARRLLYAAFGPDKGESLLTRAVPEARENPFAFLEGFSGEQGVLLLREESAMTAALILSQVSPKFSAAVLAHMKGERKLEILRRIARLESVSPEVLERVAAGLREKARHIAAAGGSGGAGIDGMNALTAILKHSDASFGDRILGELEEDDPDLSRDIKERLHTLDDVIRAEDRPLQEKLRAMSDRDIALLLKGRSRPFAEKILSNVSSQRRSRIREEEGLMGPVSRRETEAAAREFLAWFRLSREEGRILLIDSEDVVL